MISDNFLHRLFLMNGGKRLHKWLHYFDIYERHFARFRGRKPVVVEIGVKGGGSLQMWKEYFGEGARIVGIDIDPACKEHEEEGIEVFTGSQDNPDFLATVCEKYPVIDIVIDDGSHLNPHMIASFECLYNNVAPRGVYLVEDCYLCYRRRPGAGLRKKGTFIEYAKEKIDELHAAHNIGLPVSGITLTTDHIAFYDSVVVFEKAPQGRRQNIRTHNMGHPVDPPGRGRAARGEEAEGQDGE